MVLPWLSAWDILKADLPVGSTFINIWHHPSTSFFISVTTLWCFIQLRQRKILSPCIQIVSGSLPHKCYYKWEVNGKPSFLNNTQFFCLTLPLKTWWASPRDKPLSGSWTANIMLRTICESFSIDDRHHKQLLLWKSLFLSWCVQVKIKNTLVPCQRTKSTYEHRQFEELFGNIFQYFKRTFLWTQ